MARLLDAPLELGRQLAIEEQHRLAHGQPVLHPAEAQHVDAGAPGEVRRRALKRRQRVGKARAVHVHLETVAPRHLGQRADLARGVDGAELGGLGDATARAP